MEDDIVKQLAEQGEKIEKIYKSVRRMQKYFEWTFILTIVFFVLPLIGLAFVIPLFLKTSLGSLNVGGLGF